LTFIYVYGKNIKKLKPII